MKTKKKGKIGLITYVRSNNWGTFLQAYATIKLLEKAAISSVASYNLCGIAFLIYFHKKSNIGYKEILLMKKSDFKALINKVR